MKKNWLFIIFFVCVATITGCKNNPAGPADPGSVNPVFVLKWGVSGTGAGQFSHPKAVTVDSVGAVYVLDDGKNMVLKYDPDGNFITEWGGAGSANGTFNTPMSIAVDCYDMIYVADTNNCRIQKFDPSGNFVLKWGYNGTVDGALSFPSGIATDAYGTVYVANTAGNRIDKFGGNGLFLSKWGTSGSGDGQFNSPDCLAVDKDNNVYVNDSWNHRIQKFTHDGAYLNQWAGGNPMRPMAVDGFFNLFTTGFGIVAYDRNGANKKTWGVSGAADGEFSGPYGITVDTKGKYLYVVDTGNYRIQKFSY